MTNNLDSVSIIIISGFLGSGKTTLIKKIIEENKNFKFGFIQNEFSDKMGIEKPLFVDTSAKIYELPSGCLCCSAKSEFASAIESLINVRNNLNCILVEASGVSNVIDLASSLWVDSNSKSKFFLSTIVVLVDGLNFLKTIKSNTQMSTITIAQISCVSHVIITKIDYSSPEIESKIRDINLNCVIHYLYKLDTKLIMQWNDFTHDQLIDLKCNSIGHLDTSLSKFIHLNSQNDEILSLGKINEAIASLLWTETDNNYLLYEIFRCKGIFNALDDSEVIDDMNKGLEWFYTLQGVGNMFEILPVSPKICTELKLSNTANKFLFITNSANKDSITRKLQQCIIKKNIKF